MAYNDKVIEHYENPRNVGSLDKGDRQVGTGLVGAPACGDVMKLQIKVGDDGVSRGRPLQDLRLRARPSLRARWPPKWIKGRSVDEAAEIRNTHIAEHLSLPPVKIHCSVLAEDAIKAAIADYRTKQADPSPDAD